MATTIQLLRSDISSNRPDPGLLNNGVPMVNLHESEPGLFFSNRIGELFKVGPAYIGTQAPNSQPEGHPGNSKGELWLDQSGSSDTLKVYDGASWKVCVTYPEGTVTSVNLSFPDGIYTVTDGPVTSSGSLTAALVEQNKNRVFAAPASQDGTPSFRLLDPSDIPGIPASKVVSGLLDTGRIPGLDSSKIVSGTFSTARIPNLNASKITSGTLPFTRGGTGIENTPGNGEILIGTGLDWEKSTLSHDSNLSVTNGSGSITIGLSSSISISSVLFEGTDATYPSIRRNSASLEAKLADDSDFTDLSVSSLLLAKSYTVSSLPAASFGRIAYVDDATAPSIGSPVVGGGALTALCWFNGSTWTVIGI